MPAETDTLFDTSAPARPAQNVVLALDEAVFHADSGNALEFEVTVGQDCQILLDFYKDADDTIQVYRRIGGDSAKAILLFENNSSSAVPASTGRVLQGEWLKKDDTLYGTMPGTAADQGVSILASEKA